MCKNFSIFVYIYYQKIIIIKTKNMINFIKGLFWLGVVLGQIYISEFTELKNYYCFLITIPLAMITALVLGGTSKGALFAKDAKGVPVISLTLGLYLMMQLILVIFTFIALGER